MICTAFSPANHEMCKTNMSDIWESPHFLTILAMCQFYRFFRSFAEKAEVPTTFDMVNRCSVARLRLYDVCI